MNTLIALTSVWGGLITSIQNIVLPIIVFVVGGLAVVRGIKGRFMEMVILLVVTIVALIFFLNPGIIETLAGRAGDEISGSL